MITVTKQSNSVLFEFENNQHYLQQGTMEVPFNSLILVEDESDMITFRKASTNDILFSAMYTEFSALGETKDEVVSVLEGMMFAEVGGSVDPQEVEAIVESALTDYWTSAETQSAINQATSGIPSSQVVENLRTDVNTISGDVASLQTNKLDASAYTPTDLSQYWTSGETEAAINQAVSGKADYDDFSLVSEKVETMDITIASALTYLDETKLDASALDDYYEKVSGLTIEFKESHQAPQITIEADDEETGNHYSTTMNKWMVQSLMSTSENGEYGSSISQGTIGNIAFDHPQSGISSDRQLEITTDGFTQRTENMDDNEGYSPYRSESEFNYGTGLEMHNTWAEPDQENVGEFIESSSRVTIHSQQFPYIELEDVDGNLVRIDTYGINGGSIVTEDYVDASVSGKADTSAVTAAIDAATSGKADTSAVTQSLSTKQDTLVSGANIKTINNESLLGSGNITISGGASITIDPTLDSGSTNAVANSAITNAIGAKLDASAYTPTDLSQYWTSAQTDSAITQAVSGKQDTLTAGTGIDITSNVISFTGSSSNFVELTQAQYDALVSGGTVDPDALYIITDASEVNLSGYVQTSAITTAVTSASTDSEIPTALAVYTAIGQGGGGSSVNVVQTTGTSTTDVMSQSAVTTQLNTKADALALDRTSTPIKNVGFRVKRGGVNGTTISSVDLTLGRGLVYGEEGAATLSTSGLVETSAITTSMTSSSTDAQVPSAKAVYDATQNMQVTTNLVTSVSSASTDTQYPSAKLLYDTVGDIQTLLSQI